VARHLWQTANESGGTLLLDGGTASELRRRGVKLDPAAWSALGSLTHYDLLCSVHEDYIAAGADLITTNTFATTRFVLDAAGYGEQFATINARAVAAARQARDAAGRDVLIAGSMSCLPPRFDVHAYPDERVESAAYRELAETLAEAGVDLLLLEMMQETRHAPLACSAARGTGLPYWLGVSCRLGAGSRLVGFDFPLVPFTTCLDALLPLGPETVAVMHSPLDATHAALAVLCERADPVNLAAYPEWPEDDVTRAAAPEFGAVARELSLRGARAVGGCCGTRPEDIRGARAALVTAAPGSD
jgi:homocysteine S-methyltransferase